VPDLARFRFLERLDYILTGDAYDDARRLAQRMLDTDRERTFGSSTLLRGYLLQLIGLVSTQYAGALGRLAQSHGAQKAGRRDALARVMRHIRANLTSGELTLTGTAEAAFLSPNYLAHLIRKETGSTFTELVTERRIALAQSLLAHTTRRIADIAHDVGFRDEGYFSRRFRACVGMSPKDYREANDDEGEARSGSSAAGAKTEGGNTAEATAASSPTDADAAGPAPDTGSTNPA
jgi:AraC-like DNA-binding protein